ncbi:hypothetical protein D1AOALGA4SA_10553 [Olavius algarvensis Delta 1 endosymbiont]|nr:hypothetical protein D1AOALGA4SA_10553 [Olavius algarvensis Delta 1 endosymbiont]
MELALDAKWNNGVVELRFQMLVFSPTAGQTNSRSNRKKKLC